MKVRFDLTGAEDLAQALDVARLVLDRHLEDEEPSTAYKPHLWSAKHPDTEAVMVFSTYQTPQGCIVVRYRPEGLTLYKPSDKP